MTKTIKVLLVAVILLISLNGIMFRCFNEREIKLQQQNNDLKREITKKSSTVAKLENDIKEKKEEIIKIKQETVDLRRRIEELSLPSMLVRASAYSNSPDEGSGLYITKTGYSVKETIQYQGYGIVATDWNLIPPYSIVKIEGFEQKFVVLDTGGRIKGNKIDILLGSKQECFNFGKKELKLTILGKLQ